MRDGFFLYNGNHWLQLGHNNYRMVVEPIDIANYYHHRFWRDSGHYLEDNNRPIAYKFFEERWAEACNKTPDSVQLAREKQHEIEGKTSSLPSAVIVEEFSRLCSNWVVMMMYRR